MAVIRAGFQERSNVDTKKYVFGIHCDKARLFTGNWAGIACISICALRCASKMAPTIFDSKPARQGNLLALKARVTKLYLQNAQAT